MRLWLAATVGLGVLGAGGAVAWWVATTREPHDDGCGEAALAGVWDADERAAVQAALVGLGPIGSQAFARVGPELDRYTAVWVANHRRVCSKGLDRDCLHERRSELAMLVEGLNNADILVAQRAVAATRGLTDVSVCAEDRHPGAREALARAKTLNALGHYGPAEAAAREALTLALEADDGTSVALARARIGGLLVRTGDRTAAIDMLKTAHSAALTQNLERPAVETAIRLMSIDSASHKRWRDVAMKAAKDARQRVELRREYAAILIRRNEIEPACKELRQAVDIATEALPPDDLDRAAVVAALALCLDRLQKPADALPLHEAALAAYRSALGDRHPAMAAGFGDLGANRLLADDIPAAVAAFSEALAVRREGLGADHPGVADALADLAAAKLAAGGVEDARAHYTEAIEIMERTLGADHADIAIPLVALADLERKAGRPDAARVYYERAAKLLHDRKGQRVDDLRAQVKTGLAALNR